MSLLFIKSLSQLLLPPGGLILLGLLGLLFNRRFWGKALIFFSLAGFWLLATEPVRDAILSPLESHFPVFDASSDSVNSETTAIVLLGGGLYEKAPEYGGVDSLSNHAMMRTIYATKLARQSGMTVITTGGAVLSETTEPEGVVMRRWLMEFGVTETAIVVEAMARNTWENAANVKAILEKNGFHKALLVTTAWHMPRAVQVFESHGITVIPAPCYYKVEDEPYDLRSYLPRWNVLADSCDGLHEYLGLLWYRLRY